MVTMTETDPAVVPCDGSASERAVRVFYTPRGKIALCSHCSMRNSTVLAQYPSLPVGAPYAWALDMWFAEQLPMTDTEEGQNWHALLLLFYTRVRSTA